MSINSYDQGTVVRMEGAFEDSDCTPIDPDYVQLSYERPDLVVTVLVYGIDPQVIRASVGNYYADIFVSQAGTWRFRFLGEGGIGAANDEIFNVRGSPLA